ncbi:MAG: hypothetical protein ABSA51_01935 [Anaerolineaceae bacterium]
MTRIQLFEFTDLSWYPQEFRDIQTDYLQFASSMGAGHKNLVPIFQKALGQAKTSKIVDLCSGGMGPWRNLQKQLNDSGLPVRITLTDKYPNPKSITKVDEKDLPGIEYCPHSIDARDVPEDMDGMRTMFEGFHHFRPEDARKILSDAQAKGKAIGVFEASLIPPAGIILLVLSPIITLMTYLLVTPFIRPFRLSRILWTYLLPVVPLATCWDGVISLLRVYSEKELNDLVDPIRTNDYVWETGQASTGTPIFNFTYIVGYPGNKSISK